MLCSLLTAGVYRQWDGGSGGSGVTGSFTDRTEPAPQAAHSSFRWVREHRPPAGPCEPACQTAPSCCLLV